MDVELEVLGCRAGMPADGQASSGYLVTTAGSRLLMDCGPGVATVLSAAGGAQGVDGIVISHLHLDHCYDLLPIGKTLLSAHASYPDGSDPTAAGPDGLRPVPLLVPAGARAVLDDLAALFPVRSMPLLDKAFEVAFDVREYEPGDVTRIGDCRISLHELRHAVPNCGIRLDAPSGSLAYTGDTGMTDALIALADGVDLLLAEASLERTDTGPHGHLSGADAGRVAAGAGAGRLVLTHFASTDPMWTDARLADAARHFTGPIHIAAPGRRFLAREPVPNSTRQP
ncbi:MBL fold metallo-hydrolase [Pseudonocardia sp. DSM 110487]|uniref:MBL fold metallo-hydrolase n=1 Tax=Pseudonocardia sp. DSM 110487 TaxID=2865833 RepID=UPI0021064259|nr:MBL fold metallo-hydrolase [Pseudonocardia sp. DSM 110487]